MRLLLPILTGLGCLGDGASVPTATAVSANVVPTVAGETCASTQTAVWPIFGRATTCPYCDVVGAAFADARVSIDLLLASLVVEDDPLVDALVAAAARGVVVRVLLDQSDFEPSITEKNGRAVEYLAARGVAAKLDDPGITTHAKLAVIDRGIVVLGSTNWNAYALREHRQADVRIDDERAARVFGAFFDRIWADPAVKLTLSLDGVTIPVAGPTLVALPDAGSSTLYASMTADLLASAAESVHVVLYRVSIYPQFADSATTKLVRALVDAARRGLDVRVLIDDCSYYSDSAEANLESAIFLYQSGVDVRFDDPAVTTHAKLVVIDGETVVLGSTNWNYYSVERNIEANVALVRMPEVAGSFESYFSALWSEGRELVP